MLEFWLSTIAGVQVPEMPLLEVVGRFGTTPTAQISSDVPKLNVGGTTGLTVTLKFVEVAH